LGEVFVDKAPTRYISSFIIEFISDFICHCNDQHGFSADEVAILCLVVSQSTRELRNDAFVSKNYGNEDFVFPSEYRPPVSVKFIHTNLGMARETVRRKLDGLVKRNFLYKVKGGYVFPAQVGDDDYTKELRNFLVQRLSALENYVKRMPE
jgi:predicted DNA-binding transcriptional regulator